VNSELTGLSWKNAASKGVWVFLWVVCVLTAFGTGAVTSNPALAQESQSPSVTGARIAGDDVRTRFVLDLSMPVAPAISGLASPYRLIIDLPEVAFELPVDTGKSGRGLINAWRFGSFAPGKSRIVLDAAGPVAIDKTFVLPAVDDQPVRMVLDLVRSTPEDFDEFARESRPSPPGAALAKGDRKPKSANGDRPVIVLDPGHGGIDSGAKGVADGTLEKVVVLNFASILKRKLEETGLYSVHLTRETDVFIPLGRRVQIARELEADLFVSIHADAVKRGKTIVRGASVYTLSEKASDKLAEELAETENRSDVIAGVELTEEPTDVTDILLALTQRETKNFSLFYARTLVEELRSAVKLINNPLRSAGFRVLMAHDVPSVLVEIGYLSNKHDEKLMASEDWRDRLATAIADSIATFFRPRLAAE